MKQIPSETTIGNILRKKGLVKPKKKDQEFHSLYFLFPM
ncbi:hypothetical protein LEP1GSC199_4251 [Leptospira vanthielii serovar Holland str. Waz Holland = ATCC 700522]|nr:hypothetical protein LEP1GSC199_4251 [Leptospira vanthielii serovar Holland str. Waz Holland = ATCC 700522]